MNPDFDHHAHARRMNYLESRGAMLREHLAELEAHCPPETRRPLLTRFLGAKKAGPDDSGLRAELDETRAALAAATAEFEEARRSFHDALHEALVEGDDTYRTTIAARRLYVELEAANRDFATALAGLREPDARVRRSLQTLARNHGVDMPDVVREALQAWHAACATVAAQEARLRANTVRFRRIIEGSVFVNLYVPDAASVFETFDAGPGAASDKLAMYERISPAVTRGLAAAEAAKAGFATGLDEFESLLHKYRDDIHRVALAGV